MTTKGIMAVAFALIVLAPTAAAASDAAPTAPPPRVADDVADMLLSGGDNGTRYAWPLQYGQARRQALVLLEEGRAQEALLAARMQFVLCPIERAAVDSAVKSVTDALVALDGNPARADAFEQFAFYGPAGPDKIPGTADDLANPLYDVALGVLAGATEIFAQSDSRIDALIAVGDAADIGWYETEKAFARLNGGDWAGAAAILVPVLAQYIRLPHGFDDDSRERQRNQDVLDRVAAGLGVIYRARTGTLAGVSDFLRQCTDFALYGPMGRDGRFGTGDDLVPPL